MLALLGVARVVDDDLDLVGTGDREAQAYTSPSLAAVHGIHAMQA